jgi:transposase
LGYVRDKFKFKLDERGIRYRSVQPAYSSQQCSRCGFTFPLNRRAQAEFRCLPAREQGGRVVWLHNQRG